MQARQKVKLPWELYWKKNKTYKLRKSVNGLNCEVRGEMTVSAGVIFQLIILQQTKTVPYYSYDKPDIKLANRIVLQNQKCFCIPESGFHCMSRENSWCGTYRVLKNQEFLTRPNALVVLSSKMARQYYCRKTKAVKHRKRHISPPLQLWAHIMAVNEKNTSNYKPHRV